MDVDIHEGCKSLVRRYELGPQQGGENTSRWHKKRVLGGVRQEDAELKLCCGRMIAGASTVVRSDGGAERAGPDSRLCREKGAKVLCAL